MCYLLIKYSGSLLIWSCCLFIFYYYYYLCLCLIQILKRKMSILITNPSLIKRRILFMLEMSSRSLKNSSRKILINRIKLLWSISLSLKRKRKVKKYRRLQNLQKRHVVDDIVRHHKRAVEVDKTVSGRVEEGFINNGGDEQKALERCVVAVVKKAGMS